MSQTMTKQTLSPLGNRVLAKRIEQTEKLKGGLLLPDNAKKPQEKAIVLAVGPGLLSPEGKLLPMPVKVGDTILMDKYSASEIKLNDEELLIVRSDEIIAIITE